MGSSASIGFSASHAPLKNSRRAHDSHDNTGNGTFTTFPTLCKNYFWIIYVWFRDSDFSDFSDFMWKLFLRCSCLAHPLREAEEPMMPTENSRILTFPTLYEDYFWFIHAYSNLLKMQQSPSYHPKKHVFWLSEFSDLKWKLIFNNSCLIPGFWLFRLFQLYTKTIIEVFLPDSRIQTLLAFLTFCENYFCIILALFTLLEKQENTWYPPEIPGFWLFWLFRLYMKTIFELILLYQAENSFHRELSYFSKGLGQAWIFQN